MDNLYSKIASKIIEQQETIIGPIAVEQAKTVPNINIDWEHHLVVVTKQDPEVIDELVRKYERLFGRVSVEVCKDATARLVSQLPANKRPKTLW